MNRAMFSGVAGLKTHQTKMDVIGNNIANVNTYGYKSQRAVFSDMYYQTIRSASAGTTSRGGTNPSSVGYGSSLAAIQTQMGQSSMQSTGYGMDVAITGEGFLQVMDSDGNIFYTKAGLLDYDSNGYLVDINGNFVLGAAGKDSDPSSQKIRLDNIGSVSPKKPTITELINGTKYTISASNASKYGNVAITIGASEDLPAGLKASASISSTGAISVQLNAYEKFDSMYELNNVINKAITEANGGKQHAAGTFTISSTENKFGIGAVDGTWTGTAKGEAAGLTADLDGILGGALTIKSLDYAKLPVDETPANLVLSKTVAGTTTTYNLTTTINGITYKGSFAGNIANGGTIELTDSTTPSDHKITLEVADKDQLLTAVGGLSDTTPTITEVLSPTPPAYFLGGASIDSVSSNFSSQGPMTFAYTLSGGKYQITATVDGKTYTGEVSATDGGTATLKTATPDVDGEILLSVPSKAKMMQNYGIDSTAANAATQLTDKLNASLTQHNYVAVPAVKGQTTPLTGAEIAGTDFAIHSGTIDGLESGAFGGGMTFMKTSTDFSGSGVLSSNDFKAVYTVDGDGTPSWKVTMNINGVPYSESISAETKASSLLLKSPGGDYIQVTNPGFSSMNSYFSQLNPGTNPTNGDEMLALTGSSQFTITPATPSKDLGLSSVTFALAGGTEGGAVTLDQLSSIAIGSDGTVSVTHAEKGTVVAGKISLANFANPSGLQLEGTNYYSATVNSGSPKLCDPGSDGTGGLKSNALEMSNVDLSAEFAEMITTQRGFQANSRIITVSDTMLEELINLKR